MDRGPEVGTVADIGGYAVLTSDRREHGDEAVQGTRVAHDAGVQTALGQRESSMLGRARERGHYRRTFVFGRRLPGRMQEAAGDNDGVLI